MSDDFRIPDDWREQLKAARAQGSAELAHNRATANAHKYAKPSEVWSLIPKHPETEPEWHRTERLANRKAKRRGGAVERVGDVAEKLAELDAIKRRDDAHDRRLAKYRADKRELFARHSPQWDRLKPRAPKRRDKSPLRPATRQQIIAARMAIASEEGCRAAIASLPVAHQRAFVAWADELASEYRGNAYASPYASRAMRKTVATLCAILYAARCSWREGITYVTTGLGREGIVGVIGAAPESGRPYSLSAMSHVDTGSLPILERLGILYRDQLPGDRVPECDRGCDSGRAFNHYMFTVDRHDQWAASATRPNPSAPRDLLVALCPWLALTDGDRVRIADARAAAEYAANHATADANAHTRAPELDASPVLTHGAELPPPSTGAGPPKR